MAQLVLDDYNWKSRVLLISFEILVRDAGRWAGWARVDPGFVSDNLISAHPALIFLHHHCKMFGFKPIRYLDLKQLTHLLHHNGEKFR
jgi:hypothetical protein